MLPKLSANAGYKVLREDEWFFKVHWPNDPNMPGMLQLEALTQLCALAIFCLPDLNINKVYMKEDIELCTYFKHHKMKLTLFLTAMRDYRDLLEKNDFEEFTQNISEKNKAKIVSAQKLATAWIETRTEAEMEIYKQIVTITKQIINEAFSLDVIQIGKTTTTDLEWWMRQKVTDLGLNTWFHPSVDIQRKSEISGDHLRSFSNRPAENIIMKGDLLHCDFGITYLRLNSDCQQMAYVLKDDEKDIPTFLRKAFSDANILQDILTSNFVQGNSGNEILLNSLSEAKSRGLRPSIYTHPLGSYGHSSGPTIGMWDSQVGVVGTGDYPLNYNTVYAIELNNTSFIKEWNRDIRIMLEEAGFFDENGHSYVNGRQTGIKIINPKQ